jgi:hypothetical protein
MRPRCPNCLNHPIEFDKEINMFSCPTSWCTFKYPVLEAFLTVPFLEKRYIRGTRPVRTPDGDLIAPTMILCNAPRPLQGSYNPGTRKYMIWQGDFISGIFYALVSEYDIGILDFNHSQKAVQLIYVSEEELKDFAIQHLKEYGLEFDPEEHSLDDCWLSFLDNKEKENKCV